MIKLVTLLKRRAGLSRADFIAYYESRHRKIGEQVLGGFASHYMRRFLHPTDGIDRESDFDVLMEIWFPDQARMDACFAHLAEPAVAAMIAADEEMLFDRTRNRSFVVEEHVSDMPAAGTAAPDV